MTDTGLAIEEDDDGIQIGLLRRAFGKEPLRFDLFDEDFLSKHSCMFNLYNALGVTYDLPSQYREHLSDPCLSDVIQDYYYQHADAIITDVICSFGIYYKDFNDTPILSMSVEAGQLFLNTDRYTMFLDTINNMRGYIYSECNRAGALSADEEEGLKEYLFHLMKEHVFDMSLVSKKEAVVYLYKKGYEPQRNVPRLTQWECKEIIKEREANDKGNIPNGEDLPEDIIDNKTAKPVEREYMKPKEVCKYARTDNRKLREFVKEGLLKQYFVGTSKKPLYDKKEVFALFQPKKHI